MTKLTAIGDKITTYLTLTPDELFWVIACRGFMSNSRGILGEFILNFPIVDESIR